MIYLKEYRPAEEYITVNDGDPDLTPIDIKLPKPPPLHQIEGYGKPAKDQKWKVSTLPERLQELQDSDDLETLEEMWAFLTKNQADYKEELLYIEEQWRRRQEGYWFFNNGRPTYLTGTNYFYINFWELDVGLPEYRNRDRKFFLFAKFCEDDDTCVGFNYPKHRREGATAKTQCWMYDYISQHKRSHGGIQSMTEDHARDGVFQDHLVAAWKCLPFFFQPTHEGTTNPKSAMKFFKPGKKVTKGGIRAKKDEALNSYIDFKPSNKGAYDTFKLKRYHGDEVGKTVEVDTYRRHHIVKQCLTLGGGRIVTGKAIYTSTVGEMEKEGGENFLKLCKDSHHNERTENNQTKSGLYNLFIPAWDGLEGFVDEYGDSVVENPEKPIKGHFEGKAIWIKIGSREYIKNTRQAYIDDGNFESYNEEVRMYPTSFAECFKGQARNCNFNIMILENRLADFNHGNKLVARGNFKWEENVKNTRIEWHPDPTSGKFYISYNPAETGLDNKRYFDGELWLPDNVTRFTAGADPYKFRKTKGTVRSDGAGAVFMKRDYAIDQADRPRQKWESHRFCCTYRHRPATKFEYAEDMLMMCIFYGCEMNCEINVDLIWEHFEDRGFSGYLYYGIDKKTNRINKTPGVNTLAAIQEEIYREYHTYIEKDGKRERHDDLLRECLRIEDDMGPYDLFVAGGMALLAAKQGVSIQEQARSRHDLSDYIQTYALRKN